MEQHKEETRTDVYLMFIEIQKVGKKVGKSNVSSVGPLSERNVK